MARDFAQSPLEEFIELGYVLGREEFSRPLLVPGQSIIEVDEHMDSFDPLHPGLPLLTDVPKQAEEAVAVMMDDMRETFEAGSYVLRILFRQGDAARSLDQGYNKFHCDMQGNCLATYIVNDEDPTIAFVDGEERSGHPFQVLRIRGDVPHRRPDPVSTHRTTVIANIIDQPTFESLADGAFAQLLRSAGLLKPVQYEGEPR